MRYEIKGGSFPVVICTLDNGEKMITEKEEELEEHRALRFEPEYYQDMKKMAELDDEIDEIHNKIHALEEKWEEAMLFEEEKNK